MSRQNTVSIVADILFYNKETHSFVYTALKVHRRPSGLIKPEFEFHKPIGQKYDNGMLKVLNGLEYFQLACGALFIFCELVMYLGMLVQYCAAKGELQRQRQEKNAGGTVYANLRIVKDVLA